MPKHRRHVLLAISASALLFGFLLRRKRTPRRLSDEPGAALITGASSGIGAEFARQLAARGYRLVLVARRAKRLTALAAELEHQYSVATEILVADLANAADVEQVEKRIAELPNLSMLVNNAGFGAGGNFAVADIAAQIEMIQIHNIATVRLTRAALPGMIARHHGAIVNLSSTAALVPIGGNAVYAASKSFLNSFSRALQIDLMGTGVRVQALCPGFTHTEFHDRPEYKRARVKARIPGPLWLTAETVVAESLAALERDQVIVIPGWIYRLGITIARSPIFAPIIQSAARRLRGQATLI